MADYAKKLEETLKEAGVVRPVVQAAPQSTSRPDERVKATFSSVLRGSRSLASGSRRQSRRRGS
jgi:hypothetical protein